MQDRNGDGHEGDVVDQPQQARRSPQNQQGGEEQRALGAEGEAAPSGIDRRRKGTGKGGDEPGLNPGAHHDEQEGEEDQRRPFDLVLDDPQDAVDPLLARGVVLSHVEAILEDERGGGTDRGRDRRWHSGHAVREKADEDEGADPPHPA